jgi:hypothetical protein
LRSARRTATSWVVQSRSNSGLARRRGGTGGAVHEAVAHRRDRPGRAATCCRAWSPWVTSTRTATGQPGLYLVGLSFLYAMSSGFLPGVDRDAEHVVDAILA